MANKIIETINSRDSNLIISENNYTPHYNPDDKNLHDGAVRTNRGGLEYYDAGHNCWLPLPGSNVNIELSPYVQDMLEWAYARIQEELKIKELVEKYPALKQAKENYDIIKAIVSND